MRFARAPRSPEDEKGCGWGDGKVVYDEGRNSVRRVLKHEPVTKKGPWLGWGYFGG